MFLKSPNLFSLLTLVAVIAMAGTAQAAIIAGFDFGAGDAARVQPGFTAVTSGTSDAVTSTGDGIGIEFDTNASGIRDRGITAPITGHPDAAILRDLFFWSTADAITFTLSGLDANTTYDIVGYIFDSESGNSGKNIDFTTSGGTVSVTTDNTDASNSVFDLESLTTDANGQATIVMDHTGGAGGAVSFINGFAIVPEPASLALVGLGGLMILGRRRQA